VEIVKIRRRDMKRVPLDRVKPYAARGHILTSALRLSGKDETGATKFWVGLSHFLPGGGVEYSGEDQTNEKVYIVLKGELTVKSRMEEFVLRPLDTLYIAPNEGRSILNKTNEPVSMLVIANY
jgi:glyoxylate utilization-related uncharacterized protein